MGSTGVGRLDRWWRGTGSLGTAGAGLSVAAAQRQASTLHWSYSGTGIGTYTPHTVPAKQLVRSAASQQGGFMGASGAGMTARRKTSSVAH